MDVWLSCLSWKPQVLECKEKEEISKRLMANHCNGSSSRTKWTLARKHKFLLQKENSHANKGTCRFVTAMFLFFVSLAQALYCGLRGGDVFVRVLKVEMWKTVFFTCALCTWSTSLKNAYSSHKVEKPGNSGQASHIGYSSTVLDLHCQRMTDGWQNHFSFCLSHSFLCSSVL